ncbi:MAG: hypothetical protein G01um101419_274 [Parcubacteria group bacterium Gr01-1014_19]|nr:MAG: hypothetical protein G01um101419_274 [Parcubacteria group bacterium Gr01-1014_19]
MIIDESDRKHSFLHYFLKGEATKRVFDGISTAVGLVNSYFIISNLSVFHFGLYQLMLSLVSILDNFNLDVIDGVVQIDMRRSFNVGNRSAAKRLYWDYAKIKLGISVVFATAVFFGSSLISKYYGEDLGLFIRISSFLLIFRALQSLETMLLKSLLTFSYWSYPAIRESAKLLFVLGFLFFSGQFTITQVITAHVIADGVAVVVMTLTLFINKYRKAFMGVVMESKSLVWGVVSTYGKWAMLRYLFSKVSKNSTPWLIKYFINTEAVAFYALAVNLIAFIENFFPMDGLAQILAFKADNLGQISSIFKRAVKYAFWLGVIFMIGGAVVAAPVVVFIFPKYGPAMPVFYVMLLALPVFGLYKILKSTLTVLREQKILTMRVFNEAVLIPATLVIFLPFFRLVGAGFTYALLYLERSWFFYSQLVKKYPDFKIKPWQFLRFDRADRDLLERVIADPWRKAKNLIGVE